MMQRRDVLRAGAGALAGFNALWGVQEALAMGLAAPQFQTQAPELAPLRGFGGHAQLDARDLRIEGRLPSGLNGVYYRNGPGLMARGEERYQQWFDGDGLVQAWRFEQGRVQHKARFVQTQKLRMENAAGRFMVPGFGTRFADQEARAAVRKADDVNTANTSVMLHQGRLYALWEGGSAYELDPISLASKGPRAWSEELAGMPFSAHPKVEADGTVWNFGSQAGRMVIYQISAQGQLQNSQVLNMPVASAMVHDFAVSQRYLVFVLAPLDLDMEAAQAGSSLLDAMRWHGREASTVWVIDKSDLSRHWLLEMPASMVFHFGNAWDDGQHIHLDYVEAPPFPQIKAALGDIMRGLRPKDKVSSPRLMRITLGADGLAAASGAGSRGGRIELSKRDESVEFPVVDPRVVAQRYRHVYYPCAIDNADRWGYNGLMHLDIETGHRERFSFGPDVVLEEHVLVPKPGSSKEGEGWLLGLGYDCQAKRSFASVFEAQSLKDGPLARVWLPYWVSYGFHGKFYPG